uniref:Uncharacterized protein n=1 Tax=Bionectria ochroleuca TaxID=29856 RepID=A0A8H7N3S6_BIOOC
MGATYSNANGQELGVGGGSAVTLGTEEVNVELKGEGSLTQASDSDNKVDGPCNFVLGVRLLKFYHKKQYRFLGKKLPGEKQETKKAVLLDASYAANDEDDELVPVELDTGEAAKMIL